MRNRTGGWDARWPWHWTNRTKPRTVLLIPTEPILRVLVIFAVVPRKLGAFPDGTAANPVDPTGRFAAVESCGS